MPRRQSNAPSQPVVATIDIGTTSARAILFNQGGVEVAKHQIEYPPRHRKLQRSRRIRNSLEEDRRL